jgi:hypothetical protein
MPNDIPTYLWGDTIRLRMEVEHEENLVAVWAIFRKEGETFEFWLRLRTSYNLRLMEWHGERRISEVILESTVDRSNQLPGTYDLMAVRAIPRPPLEGSRRPGGAGSSTSPKAHPFG